MSAERPPLVAPPSRNMVSTALSACWIPGRELRADDVAGAVDVLAAVARAHRLQLAVDGDVAVARELDAHRFEPEAAGDRLPPGRGEHDVGVDRLPPALAALPVRVRPSSIFRHFLGGAAARRDGVVRHLRVEEDADAARLQLALQRQREVAVDADARASGQVGQRTTIVTFASSSAKMRANSIAMMPPPTMTSTRQKGEALDRVGEAARLGAVRRVSTGGVQVAERVEAHRLRPGGQQRVRRAQRRPPRLRAARAVNSTSTAILPSSDGASRPKPRKCGIRASESARVAVA